jgi:hypothetical protein
MAAAVGLAVGGSGLVWVGAGSAVAAPVASGASPLASSVLSWWSHRHGSAPTLTPSRAIRRHAPTKYGFPTSLPGTQTPAGTPSPVPVSTSTAPAHSGSPTSPAPSSTATPIGTTPGSTTPAPGPTTPAGPTTTPAGPTTPAGSTPAAGVSTTKGTGVASTTPVPASSSVPAGSSSSAAPSTATGTGTYPCVQTAEQGKCYYPADRFITGASGDPYLNQNVWAGTSTYKQSLHGASPEDWYVLSSANTNFGGVLTFPNTGFNMAGTVDGKSAVTSSWSTDFPHNAQTAAWAAYDLWFNNWNDEVMIQTDISANSYYDCASVATAVFDGNPWHMCRFGSERVWKPGTDDSHRVNKPSGSIDIKAILVWMERNGSLPTSSTWTAASYGFEVCDTGALNEKFWVNGFSWNAK